MIDARPILILGSPRSGTTLLGNALSQHPDVAYAEEPRLVWRHGNDRRSDALRPEDARPEVISHVRHHFAKLVQTAGAKRLLEKTPSNALRPAFLDAVYPDAVFVHVIRNGFDAALSIRSYTGRHAIGIPRSHLLRRLREVRPTQLRHYGREIAARMLPDALRPAWATPVWGPRLPGIHAMSQELGPLAIACLQWRACVEASCQFGRSLPAGRYLEFRLEDLDESLLRRVLAFTGLSEDPAVLSHFREKFRPADPTGRQADADPLAMEEIRRWIEPTMRWLDDTLPANAPGSAA